MIESTFMRLSLSEVLYYFKNDIFLILKKNKCQKSELNINGSYGADSIKVLKGLDAKKIECIGDTDDGSGFVSYGF